MFPTSTTLFYRTTSTSFFPRIHSRLAHLDAVTRGQSPDTEMPEHQNRHTPPMPAQMAYSGGTGSLPTSQEPAHYPTAHHLPGSPQASYPHHRPYPICLPNVVNASTPPRVPIMERRPAEITVTGHLLPGSEGPPATLLNPGDPNINDEIFFVSHGPSFRTMVHVTSPGGPTIQETRPRSRDNASSMASTNPATHGRNPHHDHAPNEDLRQRVSVVSINPNRGPPTLDAGDNDCDTTICTDTDGGVSYNIVNASSGSY